jgi:hypothetical protein
LEDRKASIFRTLERKPDAFRSRLDQTTSVAWEEPPSFRQFFPTSRYHGCRCQKSKCLKVGLFLLEYNPISSPLTKPCRNTATVSKFPCIVHLGVNVRIVRMARAAQAN